MSKAEMRETCAGVSEDYAVIDRYCQITKQGKISTLRGTIEAAFGHCGDTARERVNHLVTTETIIVYGKFWKYNDKGSIELQNSMRLIQSIRDAGIKEAPQNEEPSSEDLAKGVSDYAKSKSRGTPQRGKDSSLKALPQETEEQYDERVYGSD